jgi:hypothetical protein
MHILHWGYHAYGILKHFIIVVPHKPVCVLISPFKVI